jgi:phage terminase small subunit
VVKRKIQDKLIARALLKGAKKGKAVQAGGYAKSTARSKATEIVARPGVQEELNRLADKIGLTDQKLLEKHVELLDAQKTVSTVSGKDAGAGTVDFVDVPDYLTQCKAVDMGYKVKGRYTEKQEVKHSGSIDVKHEADEEIAEWLRSAKK